MPYKLHARVISGRFPQVDWSMFRFNPNGVESKLLQKVDHVAVHQPLTQLTVSPRSIFRLALFSNDITIGWPLLLNSR
jgi:hypothetical protein